VWSHRPTNPDLCLASPPLIDLFDVMNRSPQANAGEDQLVECTGTGEAVVTLDGSLSSDPDSDALTYSWTWAQGSASGPAPTVTLPFGLTCFTLTVRDPSGHIDVDTVSVTVQDTTAPTLTVVLSPTNLWPPNHTMVDIHATVEGVDLCDAAPELELVSIVSSEPDNGLGDGDTTGDIAGAELNTLDQSFRLRAERMGGGGGRVYTVTYRATDASGNHTETSALVTVHNPNN